MQNYHKHTDYTNTLVSDCTVPYSAYVKRAKELGHKVISSVEHGFQSNYYVPYELVQKNNEDAKKKFDAGDLTKEQYESELLKFVFGAEAYWVKDRHEKDRTNCHIILLAKNEEGRRDINEALSDANIDGYYGQPRVDIELLERIKPENVMVTTACIAYWKYEDAEEITERLHKHFGDNFFLEVQCHNTDEQKNINKKIIKLSEALGIDIIYGYDSHYIYESDAIERDNYISARRNNYSKDDDEETGWYMDYPDEKTVISRFHEQGILNDVQIDRAIKNTDLLLDFEDLYFDKEIKLPSSDLSMTQEQKNLYLRKLLSKKWNEIKHTIPEERRSEYIEGIKYELNAVEETGMADYFLIDYKIVKEGVANGGIVTKTGRGSGASYYINSLLGFSDIDRFAAPVKLYPDRFMSKTRILETRSLPDLDLNLGNPEIFAAAQDKVLTEIYGSGGHSYPMISYKPLKASSAFKLYAKSQGMDFDTANEITAQIKAYEKALTHAETDEDRASLSIYDFVLTEYHTYLDESKKYRNIINTKSQAPCGYLIYAGDIKREIGLIRCVSESTGKSVLTTVIDGAVAENYKFVKNDLLKVDVWLIINRVFELIGIKPYTINELSEKIKNDTAVWSLYANGFTCGINQFESVFAKNCAKKYKPQNIRELTALVSALRPGFKTQLDNFLERKSYTTGVKELDALLEDSFHYIMYQENIMTYLGWLGVAQTETYAIIKKISKKKFKADELDSLKQKLLKSWIEHTGKEDGFEKTWEIMEAFVRYAFNASHAYSYAYDSVYCAYLKAHYPYEFYSAIMQHYTDKGEKDKVALFRQEMQYAFGIKSGDYKFRADNRGFCTDKANKCINPALPSIKGFSETSAEFLYSLKDKKYDSCVAIFEELRNGNISESQIELLIKINYFSEFGNINYLLATFKLFSQLYKNKKYPVNYSKQKAFENGYSYDVFLRNCEKETPKQFNRINARAVIKELSDGFSDIQTSGTEMLHHRYEALGYMDIIDPKYKGYCLAVDINAERTPKIKLYALSNGNEIPIKIKKYIYKNAPISRGDIIKITDAYKDYKRIYRNGNWEKLDEKEWWLREYCIIK